MYELGTRPLSLLMAGGHAQMARRFPGALWQGDPERREIALTFDDGPDPRDTPRLIEMLARHQVQATFFQIDPRVRRFPELTALAAATGHTIGLHGHRHRPLVGQGDAALWAQLAEARQVVASAAQTTPDALCYLRPPFGAVTPDTLRRLRAWDFRPVMWTLVPVHWMQTAAATRKQLEREIRPGTILVLHEGKPGPSVIAEAETSILRLKQAGYRFVTVDAIWQATMR
jgi:peptidoglycan/xylan/chitin deacetylase (PgdA/CDA1 family)